VIVKPLASVVAIILNTQGLYNTGDFSPKYGYLYVSMIINVSVSVALYWLLVFYMMIHEVIEDYKPLYKLLAIKAILFFAFWQSVAIGYDFESSFVFILIFFFFVLFFWLITVIINLSVFNFRDYFNVFFLLAFLVHSHHASLSRAGCCPTWVHCQPFRPGRRTTWQRA
jgi:hypothetical protein